MFLSAINSELIKITGSNDQEFIFTKVTQAIQALMEAGHWYDTVDQVDICTGWDKETLTLPSFIGVPLAVNTDGSPLYFRGRFFQFHVNAGGAFNPVEWAWDDRGLHACMMDMKSPSQIFAVGASDGDAGKVILVNGLDKHNSPLGSQTLDGMGSPAMRLQIHGPSDFPGGLPSMADGMSVSLRNASVSAIVDLTSSSDLLLADGAVMALTAAAGSVPIGLADGGSYFISLVDARTLRLYLTRISAASQTSPVTIQSFTPADVIRLTDSRSARVLTKIVTTVPHGIVQLSQATFSGTTPPAPLVAGTVYVVDALDANGLQIYATANDAANKVNPIYLTNSGVAPKIRLRRPMAPETLLRANVPMNVVTGDAVQINNAVGAPPEPLLIGTAYYARLVDSSTISLHSSRRDAQAGTNPIVLTSAGTGNTSVVKIITASAVLGTSNNIRATGHNLPNGALIRFVTEGTYPSPLSEGSGYYVSAPSANTFTVSSTDPTAGAATPIDITTLGAGALYVAVSRAVSIVFNNSWIVDSTALNTGDAVFVSGDGQLPLTTPGLDSSTAVYIRRNGVNLVQLFDTQANANASPSLTGLLTITTLGSGNLYLDRELDFNVTLLDSKFALDNTGFMVDGTRVKLSTNGTLPAPLDTSTEYLAYRDTLNSTVSLRTTGGAPITFTTVGSGNHTLLIQRDLTLAPASTLEVENEPYSTGTPVIPGTGAPAPLVIGQQYFARRSGNDQVSLYQTRDAALTGGTAGLVTFYTAAEDFKLSEVSEAVIVSKIQSVLKPETVSTVSLYAWDEQNHRDMTLLASWAPWETEPRYRRVRLFRPCNWVRVSYQVSSVMVRSLDDYIPIQQPRAVILAVRSIDLEDRGFYDEAEALMQKAVRYLHNREDSLDGHTMKPPQIQGAAFGLGDDEVVMN